MSLLGIPIDPGALARARARSRMTQKELAESVGVAKNTIARIEMGHRKPSPGLLDRIGGVLGQDVVASMLTEEGAAIYVAPARRPQRPVRGAGRR